MKNFFAVVIGLLLLALQLVEAGSNGGGCKNPIVRKEIRSASDEERKNFFEALQVMKNNGVVDKLAKIHNDQANYVHNSTIFLAFHRYFVKVFENELQKAKPGVSALYWDWTLDAQHPENSILFTPEWFGGNGQGDDHCVKDGIFKEWQFTTIDKHCLKRIYNKGNAINALYPYEAILGNINNSANYDQLTHAIEGGCHGFVHLGMGGDMTEMYAPNDITFWLHHGMIDMIYYQWQMVDYETRKNDISGKLVGGVEEISHDTPLPGYPDVKVGDVLDFKNNLLCYVYEETGTAKAMKIAEEAARKAAEYKKSQGSGKGNSKRDLLGGVLGAVGDTVGNVVEDVGDVVKDVGDVVEDVVESVSDLLDAVGDAIKDITKALGLEDVDLNLLDPKDLKLPIPDKPCGGWVAMTGISPALIDEQHKQMVQTIKKYNSMKYYISPSAIHYAHRLAAIRNATTTSTPVVVPPRRKCIPRTPSPAPAYSALPVAA